MKINDLQRIFKNIPIDFMEDLKEIDFKTCWYGSAALYRRPMEFFDPSHPDALINETVKVFFYTDIEYITFADKLVINGYEANFDEGTHPIYYTNMGGIKKGQLYDRPIKFQINNEAIIYEKIINEHDWLYKEKYEWGFRSKKMNEQFELYKIEENKNYVQKDLDESESLLIELGLSTLNEIIESWLTVEQKDKIKEIENQRRNFFIKNYEFGARLVKHKAFNGDTIYCFYIDCDDLVFAKLLIKEKININFAAHWGGWAGPGPTYLANLNVEYGIGDLQYNIENIKNDLNFTPYSFEKIKDFRWHAIDNIKTFYKIQY